MDPWLTVAALLAAPPLAGSLYQALGTRSDRRKYPPPGRLIETPAGALHLWQMGETGPPVLLESGISASCINWRLVHEPLSKLARVYAYDRAGYGWSPASSKLRTIGALVDELNLLIEHGGVPVPLVIVGHSFGGLLARHFAARFPHKVQGLVLVDPLEPSEWSQASADQLWRLGKGVMLSRRGGWLARLGVVRAALSLLLSGSYRLPKLISKASSGRGSVVPDRIVGELRRLPQEWWPVIASHWSLPRSFSTMAEYLERLPANCQTPLDPASLRDLPLTVVTAERAAPAVIEEHIRTAAISSQGRHVLARGSGHWIQLDNPALVADEVIRILKQ